MVRRPRAADLAVEHVIPRKHFIKVAFLGSGFVLRLLARGHTVGVRNRSPASAKALEAYGAKECAASANVVTGVERVHLSLADDASVDAVLEPLAGVISPSCWIPDADAISA